MNSNIVFGILSVATLFVTVASFPQNSPTSDVIAKARELQMEIIGQIGNKIFFKNATLSSWMGGEGRCLAAGLQFASLKNRDEFAFVRQQMQNTDRLWVAGRLRGAPEQIWRAYEWSDGSDVSDDINVTPTGQELCLLVSGDDHVFTDNCYRGKYGLLCELTVV